MVGESGQVTNIGSSRYAGPKMLGSKDTASGLLCLTSRRVGQSGAGRMACGPLRLINSTPELDWQLLTKRPENIRKMLPLAIEGLPEWPWPNVWLGTTCEDQEHYDHRCPILRRIPAAIHFISYEPALGPLTLGSSPGLPDWVICGGESGKGARMMNPAWASHLLDECGSLNVAFFMKQMTQKKPIPSHLHVRELPITA